MLCQICQALWKIRTESYIIISFCLILNIFAVKEPTQGYHPETQRVKQILYPTLSTDKTLQTEVVKIKTVSNKNHGVLVKDGRQNAYRLRETISCGSVKDKIADETMSDDENRETRGFQKKVNLNIAEHDDTQLTDICSMETTVTYEKKSVLANLQEFDRLRAKDTSSQIRFPSEKICPHLNIRAKYEDGGNITCQTRRLNDSECKFVQKYVGKPREFSAKPCFEDITTQTKPLCWFHKGYRTGSEDIAGLRCSMLPCQPNPVFLGMFNMSWGKVLPDDHWPGFHVGKDLEKAIGDTMMSKDANHFRFCFLRCAINQDLKAVNLKQILIFPPILQKTAVKTPRININIVVEDAVSRAHFYRSLPKTVDSLRHIVHDTSVPATVLDFQKYQSYDSSTHSNIRRLFAGSYPGKNFDNPEAGIKELYREYKGAGYQTMFQEDVCWFEGFGSLLRPPLSKRSSQDNSSTLWNQFRNFLSQQIRPFVDTFGLSFSSCKILQDLGETNIFNGENLPKLCFNGRHLSNYFLKAAKDFLDLHQTEHSPVFSYLHLNTGHEHSGKRIINDDVHLARFVRQMAKHNNTLTILLSDHGAKTSEYATKTAHGLKEIYKPFLFMIIPRQVARFLGNERMKYLIRNQNRLVALEDLHRVLKNLAYDFELNDQPNLLNMSSWGRKDEGLFSEISPKRKCSDFKLSSDAVCQCEDEEVAIDLDQFFLDFLANIGVGEINNLIQSQYMEGKTVRDKIMTKPFALTGFGRCQRYALEGVDRVRCRVHGEERFITFTAIVETVPSKNGQEMFEVTLSHPLSIAHGFNLVKVTRLSRYSIFKMCADKQVDLHLCACDRNGSQKTPHDSDYVWKIFSHYMFLNVSKIRKLHGSCLYLIITRRQRALRNGAGQDASSFYEAINVCDNKLFIIKVLDNSLVRMPFLLSKPLPFEIIVYPNTIHHVISAFCGLPHGEFVANFKVDARDMT